MYEHLIKLLTTFFATRPIWGLFPLRIVLALVLVLESHGAFFTLAVFAAALLVTGFLGRLVGAMLVIISIPMFLVSPIGAAEAFFLVISVTLFMSGPGRFSLDRYIARHILNHFPNYKKELYVIAETPYTDRWYE
jgi:hypothetical protein